MASTELKEVLVDVEGGAELTPAAGERVSAVTVHLSVRTSS